MEFSNILYTVAINSASVVNYLGKTTFDYVPDLYKQLAGNAMFESFFGAFVMLLGVCLLYKIGKPTARYAIDALSVLFRLFLTLTIYLLAALLAQRIFLDN